MAEHAREREERAEELEVGRPQTGPAPAQELAGAVGNASFAALAERGAGILPDGRAHPEVEAAIARTRASGGALAEGTRATAEDGLGESLADVRVHTDATADALTRSVSATAFTTGSDIYFGRGEYRPGTPKGEHLIAHELAHVVQQRGAPTSGPMRVSEPGEDLETDADAVADELAG